MTIMERLGLAGPQPLFGRRPAAHRCTDNRAELRLHWLLGIALGLLLGYAWGQHDAHNPPPQATETTR